MIQVNVSGVTGLSMAMFERMKGRKYGKIVSNTIYILRRFKRLVLNPISASASLDQSQGCTIQRT
jgi:short-subunit dehydrogenase